MIKFDAKYGNNPILKTLLKGFLKNASLICQILSALSTNCPLLLFIYFILLNGFKTALCSTKNGVNFNYVYDCHVSRVQLGLSDSS